MVQLQRFNLHTKLKENYCYTEGYTVELSDGLAWTARSGELKRKKVLIHVLDSISSTVLDMRGSNPLSRSMKTIKVL